VHYQNSQWSIILTKLIRNFTTTNGETEMNILKRILSTLLTLVVMSFGPFATAGEVAIIVNSSNNQTLTLEDVKNIYNENATRWSNGKKIKVFDHKPDSPARQVFSSVVLGMSTRQAVAEASNRKITNTTKNPSKTKREQFIISVVARKPNAIGYADAANVKDKKGIRVIQTIR
jgi:ABC-type phosphate transport system substrate-binding protein